MSDAPPNLPGAPTHETVRIGPFEVVDEIGRGGQSRVYRARFLPAPDDPHALLPLERGEPAVVKVMHAPVAQAPTDAEAFSKEADLLVMLDHPGLVRAHARGMHDGKVWIALEYVEGEHLGNVLYAFRQNELRMRPEIAAVVIADLAEALAAAHALVDPRGRPLGLVHRDVSPHNVMIDIDGRVRLFDFGTAVLSLQDPGDLQVVGTPGYLSPEQARGEPPGQVMDVYGVGVMFYELLAGRRAFEVENLPDDAILATHARAERPRWPSKVPIPDEFKDVCDLLLTPEAMDRPPDAGSVFHLVAPLVDDFQAGRQALSVMVTDLVRSNRDRPPPLYV